MSLSRRDAAAALLAGMALAPLRAFADPIVPGAVAPLPSPLSSPGAALGLDPPAPAGAEEPATGLDTGQDHSEHLTAPVMINGAGPYRFLVDTGANMSCLSAKVAGTLALPKAPPRRMHTMVAARSQPVVMLDRLEVGDRRRRNVPVLALNLVEPEIDGVLAIDWLKNQRLTLDFLQKRLEIAPSRRETPSAGRVIVPARRHQGQLTIVDADLGETRISAMIDSGAELSLCNEPMLRLILDERRGNQARPAQTVHMVSIVGEHFAGQLYYLSFLRLGGLNLGSVPVLYSDSQAFELWGLKDKPAILLGMDLLSQFQAVALDFGRSEVRFDLINV